MSYGPTAVQLGAITLPNNGQPVTAESVNVPLAAIADGVKFVGRNHIAKAEYWPVVDSSVAYYGSANTTSFTEIVPDPSTGHIMPAPMVQLVNAQLNDRLFVTMTVSADVYLTTGGGILKFMLGVGATRWDLYGAAEAVGAEGRRVTLMAALDLNLADYFTEVPVIYLMGKITVDGTLRVSGPIGFQYQLLRSV